MQTVFEIFDPVTGVTEGYKSRDAALAFIGRMESAGYLRDFLPAAQEGFYVLDMRGTVKAGPIAERRDASAKADYENLCSDTNSFHVVEHRL